MQYALLIYEPEAALGPDDGSTALSELVARDLVHHQPSTTKARTPDVHILQRVKRGLMAI